jgi:hypothetical protein
LKILLAILLFLSLYTPSLVKMAAYTDCSFQLIANTDPFFCDCSKIKNFIQLPSKEDTVKILVSIQMEWQFVLTPLVIFSEPPIYKPGFVSPTNHCVFPKNLSDSQFRPPIV